MSDIFNMADTWNNGATVFTSIKVNTTDGLGGAPVYAAGSLLMDLQANGVSQFKVSIGGLVNTTGKIVSADGIVAAGSGLGSSGKVGLYYNAGISLASEVPIEWSSTGDHSGSKDTILKRSAAAVIQSRTAADAGFGALQGKLMTDTAATTGLSAGVLAALTNASIVLYDSGGQAYRVPCII